MRRERRCDRHPALRAICTLWHGCQGLGEWIYMKCLCDFIWIGGAIAHFYHRHVAPPLIHGEAHGNCGFPTMRFTGQLWQPYVAVAGGSRPSRLRQVFLQLPAFNLHRRMGWTASRFPEDGR